MRRIRPDGSAGLLMAGWLFADLLLALVIITLGSIKGSEGRADPAPTKPTTQPSPRSPSPTAAPPGISRTPVVVQFEVNTGALLAGSAQERLRVAKVIRDQTRPIAGRRAGLLLTFGYDSNISTGVVVAERVNAIARQARPGLFAAAASKELANLSRSNFVKMEIYLFNKGSANTP